MQESAGLISTCDRSIVRVIAKVRLVIKVTVVAILALLQLKADFISSGLEVC